MARIVEKIRRKEVIIKHNQETNKWVIWSGFSHKQLVEKEFDTLQETEKYLVEVYDKEQSDE